jgi:hypothetical protein
MQRKYYYMGQSDGVLSSPITIRLLFTPLSPLTGCRLPIAVANFTPLLEGSLSSRKDPETYLLLKVLFNARVAELVDALDLGSSGATRASSSLAFRTKFNQ